MDDEIVVDGGYDFRLIRREGQLVLGVLCGSSAMYELLIPLTADEETRFEKEGEDYLRQFARKISRHPDEYADRAIKSSES